MSDGTLLHRICRDLAAQRWSGPRPDAFALAEWVAEQAAAACDDAGEMAPLVIEADDEIPLPRVRVGDDGLILIIDGVSIQSGDTPEATAEGQRIMDALVGAMMNADMQVRTAAVAVVDPAHAAEDLRGLGVLLDESEVTWVTVPTA